LISRYSLNPENALLYEVLEFSPAQRSSQSVDLGKKTELECSMRNPIQEVNAGYKGRPDNSG
jgi:hypothetical protein